MWLVLLFCVCEGHLWKRHTLSCQKFLTCHGKVMAFLVSITLLWMVVCVRVWCIFFLNEELRVCLNMFLRGCSKWNPSVVSSCVNRLLSKKHVRVYTYDTGILFSRLCPWNPYHVVFETQGPRSANCVSNGLWFFPLQITIFFSNVP